MLHERPDTAVVVAVVVADISPHKEKPSDSPNCGFCQAVNPMLCLPQRLNSQSRIT